MSNPERSLEIEVVGAEDAVSLITVKIKELNPGRPVKTFRQRGAGGEAGLVGVLASISSSLLPNLFGLLKAERARDLVVKIDGLELTVRDLGELSELVDLLQDRGILPAEAQ